MRRLPIAFGCAVTGGLVAAYLRGEEPTHRVADLPAPSRTPPEARNPQAPERTSRVVIDVFASDTRAPIAGASVLLVAGAPQGRGGSRIGRKSRQGS